MKRPGNYEKKSFEYEYEKITNFEISKFENPKGSNVKARDVVFPLLPRFEGCGVTFPEDERMFVRGGREWPDVDGPSETRVALRSSQSQSHNHDIL